MKPMDTFATGIDNVKLGRMSIGKTFAGGLSAVSNGEMLGALTPVKGSAGQDAIFRQAVSDQSGRKLCMYPICSASCGDEKPPLPNVAPACRKNPDRFNS